MSKPVILRFLSDSTEMTKDLAKIGKSSDSLGTKMGALGKKVAIGIGGAAIAFGALAVKTAMDGEKATARLETAAKNAGPAFNGMGKAVEDNAGKFAKFGFAVDDVKSSIARIIPVTKSRAQAMKDESVIADVARGRNISLEAATLLVTKAQMGNSTALKKLGIDLGLATGGVAKIRSANLALTKANSNLFYTEAQIHAGRLKGSKAADALRKANEGVYYAQKHLTEVQNVGNVAVDALSKKYGGAASRQAQTFAGKMEALKAEAHNLTEKVGNALIPVLSKLLTYFVKLMEYLQKHRPVMIALGILVGTTLVAAFTAWAVSAAQAAAMTIAAAAPVIAIVAAIGLLIAAAVLVWKYWDQIWGWIKDHKAYAAILAVLMPIPAFFIAMVGIIKYVWTNWDAIWAGIQSTAETVWHAITSAVSSGIKAMLDPIGTGLAILQWSWGIVWGALSGVVSGVWGAITGAVSAGWSGIYSLWSTLTGGISSAWSAVWGGLGAALDAVWGGVKSGVKTAVNDVIEIMNAGIRLLNGIQIHVNVDSHVPGIPAVHFDWGGPGIPQIPKLAAGGIVSRPTLAMIGEGREPEVVTPLSRLGAVARAAGLAPTRQDQQTVHITTNVTAFDPADIARRVERAVVWNMKTTGV